MFSLLLVFIFVCLSVCVWKLCLLVCGVGGLSLFVLVVYVDMLKMCFILDHVGLGIASLRWGNAVSALDTETY